MQHQNYYCRPSSSDESSVDDPPPHGQVLHKALSTSVDSDDEEDDLDLDEENGNLHPLFSSRYYQAHRDQRLSGIRSVDDAVDSRSLIVVDEAVEDAAVLRHRKSNIAGSGSTHAVKCGQKLIGELTDQKNVEYMNSILREATREGFSKTLAFPHRSEWIRTKMAIWFGSGGILGG